MVDSCGGLHADFPADETETRAHVLSLTATLLLAGHTAFIVARFADEPVAIAQLNQAYFRSEIPLGSCDRMRVNVAAPVFAGPAGELRIEALMNLIVA